MLFIAGVAPRTMETARRMSQSLADYETKPQPMDHVGILTDMERDVTRMKADLGDMSTLISGLAPFSTKDKVTDTKTPAVAPSNGPLVNVDVSTYRPDELSVKAIGNNVLEVLAEHHEKNGLSESHRSFKRHFQIPPEVDISTIIPTLTPEGRLVIEAPRSAT